MQDRKMRDTAAPEAELIHDVLTSMYARRLWATQQQTDQLRSGFA